MSVYDFYRRKMKINSSSTGKNYLTLGEQLKQDSDNLMELTWDNDVASKVCYIYDYYHDDQPDKKDHMTYKNTTKTRIDAKFLVKSYQSLDKDQIDYYLQFKPSQKFDFESSDELYYFETDYRDKYGNPDFIGLYVDIPDDRGIYRKWMICAYEIANQFPKFIVLPINYELQWIEQSGHKRIKRRMWGVLKSQNSYNSGIYTYDRTTKMENQDKCWLPLNPITEKIWYKTEDNKNTRMLIGAPTAHPIAWIVSKIENAQPLGIQKITLYQTDFNPKTDYVNLQTKEMFADYYDLNSVPTNPTEEKLYETYDLCRLSASTPTLKIGGSYKLITAKIFDGQDDEVTSLYPDATYTWSCDIDGIELTDVAKWLQTANPNTIKIKFAKDRSYLGKTLHISCMIECQDQKPLKGELNLDLII